MFKGIAHDVKLVTVSVIVSSLVIGVPAAAAVYANNSDKVDGKHAVGAKATAGKRAGKLVATNKQGLLPNGIILQAMDSDLLDGMDSTDFLAADGKATDSGLLDGRDSTDFLGATGKATDAELVDGIDSTMLVKGGGNTTASVVSAGLDTFTHRPVSAGHTTFGGTWRYFCPPDPNTAAFTRFINNGNTTVDVYVTLAGSAGTWYQPIPSGDSMFIRDAATVGPNGGDIFSWTLVDPDKNLVVTAQTTSRRTATGCTFTTQALETKASS